MSCDEITRYSRFGWCDAHSVSVTPYPPNSYTSVTNFKNQMECFWIEGKYSAAYRADGSVWNIPREMNEDLLFLRKFVTPGIKLRMRAVLAIRFVATAWIKF